MTRTRLLLGERAGLAALALLAGCYLHVRESHFATLDVLTGLFCALAWERSLAWVRLISAPDTRLDVIRFLRQAGAQRRDVVAFGLHGLPLGSRHATELPFLDYVRVAPELRGERIARVHSRPPRFIVHEQSYPLLDAYGFDDVRALVAEHDEAVLQVDGRVDGITPSLPDDVAGTPSFLVPFASPWLMTRPGPGLVVYERRGP